MMKVKQAGTYLVILTACALFTGGASFKRHNLPEIGDLSLLVPGADKPTVTYEFSSEVDLVGKRLHPEHVRSVLDSEFVEVLRESGYFDTIEKGTGRKKLAIKVHLVNSGSPAAMVPAFITGLCPYIIPSWATDTFEILCKVEGADGKQYEYTLKDSSTLVQ